MMNRKCGFPFLNARQERNLPVIVANVQNANGKQGIFIIIVFQHQEVRNLNVTLGRANCATNTSVIHLVLRGMMMKVWESNSHTTSNPNNAESSYAIAGQTATALHFVVSSEQ